MYLHRTSSIRRTDVQCRAERKQHQQLSSWRPTRSRTAAATSERTQQDPTTGPSNKNGTQQDPTTRPSYNNGTHQEPTNGLCYNDGTQQDSSIRRYSDDPAPGRTQHAAAAVETGTQSGWRRQSGLEPCVQRYGSSCTMLLLCALMLSGRVLCAVIPPPWAGTHNPCSTNSWQLLHWPDDGRCYRIYTRGPCPPRMELDWQTTGARCVCAPGHQLHIDTDSCHPLHSRGPCPPGHYLNSAGSCSAREDCPPGQLFWPGDRQCHQLLSRGPCRHGELLLTAVGEDAGAARCGCEAVGLSRRHYYPPLTGCYQLETRGPCPHGLIFVYSARRGTTQCSCSRHMRRHYDADSGQCYTPGLPEPCPLGNLFQYSNATASSACRCRPGTLRWPATGECYAPYTQAAVCGDGEFVAARPEAPHQAVCVANPCLRGELYFPEDQRCHGIGRRGPCPLGQLVHYEQSRALSFRGRCGCTPEFTHNYWPSDGRCYQLHTTGPCGLGRRFVYNASRALTACVCDRSRGLLETDCTDQCTSGDNSSQLTSPQCTCARPLQFVAKIMRCVHPQSQLLTSYFTLMQAAAKL